MKNIECQSCRKEFTIEDIDQDFLLKFDVPEPTFCPKCRIIRRCTWRQDRRLYRRDCDLCKKQFLLMFPADAPFPVYCRECWLSDNWDPKSYGKEYDFNKSFFEQFRELFNVVPRVGIIKQGMSVNSEYTNRVTDMRNSYLVYATTKAENCRYGVFFNNSKESIDCYSVFNSEQCYECIDCDKCFNVAFTQESQECRDSMFLFNCRNISDCFGCVNMRNARYMMYNVQLSKEEYEKKRNEILLGGREALQHTLQRVEELRKKLIVPSMVSNRSERSSGNWIDSAKNATRCFNVKNVEDIRYCQNVFDGKDCMDYTQWGAGSELVYEAVNCGMQCGRIKFTNECWSQLMDSEYCSNCHQSSYLFGCDGIRNGQYCILNKQYTKEQFEEMIPKIKQHMSDMPFVSEIKNNNGEILNEIQYRYGEFFPEELSPFAYNESVAYEYFPMTRQQAMETGHRWKDEEKRDYKCTLTSKELPNTISKVTEDITKQVIECTHKGECDQLCTTAFRILSEDLDFYKKHNVPLPLLCPNCRHYERVAKRVPWILHKRTCQCAGTASVHKSHHENEQCPNEFETAHDPANSAIVYCIDCYNAEII